MLSVKETHFTEHLEPFAQIYERLSVFSGFTIYAQICLMEGQEARMYMEASYEPSFPVSFEKLQTTDGTDSFILYKAEVIQIMK